MSGSICTINIGICRTKYVKCHDSPLYSCASLEPNISVTGDEDRFVEMWYDRLGDTSVK